MTLSWNTFRALQSTQGEFGRDQNQFCMNRYGIDLIKNKCSTRQLGDRLSSLKQRPVGGNTGWGFKSTRFATPGNLHLKHWGEEIKSGKHNIIKQHSQAGLEI